MNDSGVLYRFAGDSLWSCFNPTNWSWAVYAGDNGSVLAYQPEKHKWMQLLQTRDENGYWYVSIRRRVPSSNGRRNDKVPVHRLVTTIFHAAVSGKTRALHSDSDKDNNEAINLRWGDEVDNRNDELKPEIVRRKKWMRDILLPIQFMIKFNDLDDPTLDVRVSSKHDESQIVCLPPLNRAKAETVSRSHRIAISRFIYQYVWHKRGAKCVMDHMPEKTADEFPNYHFDDDDRFPGKSYEIPTDTPDKFDCEDSQFVCWESVCLPAGLRRELDFIPFSRRFTDAAYSKLTSPANGFQYEAH